MGMRNTDNHLVGAGPDWVKEGEGRQVYSRPGDRLLLVGASVRAAAFSALRAGLRPWCADLFADRDLQARCETVRVGQPYPQSLLPLLDAAPPGPLAYTGAMENHPRLLAEI